VRNQRRSKWYRYVMAETTPQEIAVPSSGNGAQRGLSPTLNPAIDSDRDLKIRQALRRASRRIAFRFLLRQPRFEVEYLFLKLRYPTLRIVRRFSGNLPKFLISGHDSNRS
jgi:hypothetical protein